MKKNTAEVVNTVSSLILFLIFAVCMLIILASAANTYASINAGFDREFNSSASLRYISNKIRSADDTVIFGEGNGIAVKNGNVTTVIYCSGEGLYEKSVSSEKDITPSGGEKIFSMSALSVKFSDDLYNITVTFGGEEYSAIIGRR